MSGKNTLFGYFKKIEKPVTPKSQSTTLTEDQEKEKKVEPKNDENSPKNVESLQGKKSSKSDSSPESAKKKRKVEEKPTQKGREKQNGNKKDKKTPQRAAGKKFKRVVIEDDSSDEESKAKKKRKVSDDEVEEDWKPNDESESEEEDVSASSASEISSEESEEEEVVEKSTKKRNTGGGKKSAPKKNSLNLNSSVKEEKKTGASLGEKVWAHLKYDFLKPDKIRDADKKRPEDEGYNPHILFVPPDFMKSQTPAMRQWWEIKSKHFDCVIFIKLGKFYELYHMDASIGVNELNLVYMNHPEVAHAGFPEAAYARYAGALVEKSYKVARVEQTENPEMMQERCKTIRNPTKFDKVVKREVCQVTSKGSRMYLAIEGDAATEDHLYLYSITEGRSSNNKPVFGVCFVDTSVGCFHLGQFEDDRYESQLRTLIAMYPPAHVLLDRSKVTPETKHILETAAHTAIIENLVHKNEFLSASECLVKLHENKYFANDDDGNPQWPSVLAEMTCFKDLRTPEPEKELALSALGGCLWYLIDSKIDLQLICIKNFNLYKPQLFDGVVKKKSLKKLAGNMVLDATTMQNLDVVEYSETGEKENSLLGKLDNCCTAFGKRLLRQWLCSPLCSVSAIQMRQEAISALMKMPSECEKARKILKDLPDLERSLTRISIYGNALTAANHPESRAIFYEDFSKKKIANFLLLLKGFEKALKMLEIFQSDELPQLLRRLTRTAGSDQEGRFPEYKDLLDYYKDAFDADEALKTGKIVPRKGKDAEFEECCQALRDVDDELKDHLRVVKSKLRCEAKYFGTDRKRFQIEIPEKVVVPMDFELSSSRKGFKRYWTPESKELLVKMQAAENAKKIFLLDMNRRMFAKFADNAQIWKAATECVAILDVLLSLALYGTREETCMPAFYEPSEEKAPFVDIKNGRLPTTKLVDFIPNDSIIGVDGVQLLLLTGPNMGGKSTLMRQFGLIVIMAQIGCPVPAEECSLTPVDRIFTRIGARDHILAGESTFFVEMSETSAILKHATDRSIVLVDELGRGTSTFDGAAIASAVLEDLVQKQCLTIFSTHYHFLVEEHMSTPNISLVHMACMEEDDDDEEKSEAKVENVTLLYKLSPGACPSSYGFNAARLAGLPEQVVLRAKQQALKLQSHPKKMKVFMELMDLKKDQAERLKEIVVLLKKGLKI
ncbi:DNA mismatch repair protein Msh6-like [Neocloeon triangulifer]|uniref:DNA mismatch repair protein Msh6-like n=1 Tax=Neocloeon triangulifer TaxID=2078957 RepID=UPI00286FAA53|nr:DNA mismatch repair protein Msh6-like [Neocloeon triangulifer]